MKRPHACCVHCSLPLNPETAWSFLCNRCISRLRPLLEAHGLSFEPYWRELMLLALEEDK
jgi:hypothetical protein